MKRLTNSAKGVGFLSLDLDQDIYTQFKNNLFTALKKFGSGKKTRAVHHLIESNIVKMGIFSGEAANRINFNGQNQDRIGEIILNTHFFDDSLDSHGSIAHATKIFALEDSIRKEKTYINEKQIYNIEQLEKNKKETQEKFLGSLDYIKTIDGIYFAWLGALAFNTVQNNEQSKPKIITTTSDLLAATLKKIYSKVNPKIESDVHQLLEAIAIYFIQIFYYDLSSVYALHQLKKAFQDETLETIKMSKVTKFNEFGDLADLLKETNLLPITKTTFVLEMEKIFGKFAYQHYISNSLTDFMVVMANMSHRTQLFENAYPVDEVLHERLEELLLNEQKNIKIVSK